ncbi:MULTISPECIES: hypothetical protein [Enterobacteriaceae]|uniref:hypothetical protein n=1 Tax=Enterobacteriaceae TaxID=543 RepID=UPI0032AFA272|nr:hypothetical protein [Klebsiella pneumoniae]
MIISTLAVMAMLNGTPQLVYTFPYKTEEACKTAQDRLETAGQYEIGSMCVETEVSKWIEPKHQGWILGMVLIDEKTGKPIGSPSEVTMSNLTDCKAGLLQGLKSAHDHNKLNTAFFCFNSTQS